MMTIKLRYKKPDGDTSRLLQHHVPDAVRPYGQATKDFNNPADSSVEL